MRSKSISIVQHPSFAVEIDFDRVDISIGSRGVIPVKKNVFFLITAAIIKILEFLKF